MGWREKLQALIDGPDDAEEVPADETPADEVPADETPADEVPADEVSADETPADETPADETPGDEDSTPGADEEPPEVAELRAQLIDQAAVIETLRNQLAALGVDEEVPAAVVDEVDAEDEDVADIVEAFDRDYDERAARLAAMKEGK